MKDAAIKIPRLGARFALVFALTALMQTTSGFALGTDEQRAACTPDVFRLCSSEIPNIDRIVSCLKSKKSSLSVGCQAVFNAPPDKTATRSLATPESEWCAFGNGAQAAIQQDWLKWCGSAAHQ
jgi:hypothetical protein